MDWDEFVTLLSGINGDTPLGSVVRIRSEKDPKRRKEFTPEERRIYNEWKSRKMKKPTGTVEDGERVLKSIFGIRERSTDGRR